MRARAKFILSAAGAIGLALGAAAAESEHGAHGGGHAGHGGMEEMHRQMHGRMNDTAAFGEKGDPAQARRTLEVTASEFAFDVADLTVETGETIRFRVTNAGEQAHLFVIGDGAYATAARAMMAHMAEMGTDPASAEHAALHAAAGNALVLQPGETRELAWRFTKPGTFLFACPITGHSEAGMTGKIAVR